jgi:hypothetical protein
MTWFIQRTRFGTIAEARGPGRTRTQAEKKLGLVPKLEARDSPFTFLIFLLLLLLHHHHHLLLILILPSSDSFFSFLFCLEPLIQTSMSGASWKIQAIPPSPSPTPSPSPSSSSSSSSSPGFCSFHRSLRRSSSLLSDVQAYRHGFSACSQLRSKRRCSEFTRSRTFPGQSQQDGNAEILLLLLHPHHQPGIVHHSFPALKLRGRSRAGEARAAYSHNSNDQSDHHGRFSRNNSLRKVGKNLLDGPVVSTRENDKFCFEIHDR